MTLGQKIKKLRTDKGLTQKDLADELFVTFQTISKWENDENEPDVSTIRQLAKVFNCSFDYLLDENEENMSKDTENKVEALKGEADSTNEVVRSPEIVQKSIPNGLRVCPSCFLKVKDTDVICPHCGYKLVQGFSARPKTYNYNTQSYTNYGETKRSSNAIKIWANIFTYVGAIATMIIEFVVCCLNMTNTTAGIIAIPIIHTLLILAILVWRGNCIANGSKVACGVVTLIFVSAVGGVLTLCIPQDQLY